MNEDIVKKNFEDMYQLYKHILEKGVHVKSSKDYGPDELVTRISTTHSPITWLLFQDL